jgi:phosphate transport system substrate-binding protein
MIGKTEREAVMSDQIIKRKKFLFKKIECIIMFVLFITCILESGRNSVAYAADTLQFSCSAQAYEALEQERVNFFENQYGIDVNINIRSSGDAISDLENNKCDLASSVIRIPKHLNKKGYVETLYCKDPLVIMANPVCNIDSISEKQLRGIFSGAITSWKELGGPDKKIVVIIPDENTGAYNNFKQIVMKNKEMVFDLKSQVSTRVIEATRRFPWSISFITYGAVEWKRTGLRKMKIDGFSPYQNGYPYHQVYSFIVK